MHRCDRALILISALVGGALVCLTQTPPLPQALSSPAARGPASAPVRGGESKRWEPWSAMRTAVTPVLGWQFGVAASSFPKLYFEDALTKIDALGVAQVEASDTEKLSMEIPKYITDKLAPGEVNAIRDKLISFNLALVAYHVSAIPSDEAAQRELFEFAKRLNVKTVVTERAPADLALLDKLASEFGINVALGGEMRAVLSSVSGCSKRIGIFADTGSWLQQGLKPAEALDQVKDRLLILNLSDRSALGTASHSAPFGSGVARFPELLQKMYREQIKPSLIIVTPAGADDPEAALAGALSGFENAVRPVMAERIHEISRTTEIRGPEQLTEEDRQQIEAALPKQAPRKPRKSRKLLVLDINIAYGGHRSIPAENFALGQMGRETGAYEAVFSDNLDNLKYPKVKEYDAIFLNNTVGMIFVDPEVRDGLMRFVREGGGLAGNHGTSHASMDWAGFSDMIGVRRGVHRASTEEAWIKIDDPKSPLTQAFDGKKFLYTDEFFRFPNPPYSRDKLHVLLSIDVQKTDMNQGQVFVPGSTVARPDADYAVSWIRNCAKGRVFFCILGHNPTLFKTPSLARYFLAGIQFILGDLDADATPSARLSSASKSVLSSR